jgi:hypothetical protein
MNYLPLLRSVSLGMVIALAAASGSSGNAMAQEVTLSPEAKEKARAGSALLKDPDGARYEEAYFAFKAAYALSPSPDLLGNIGLCAQKLERDGEAIEAYSTYLAKGSGILPEERKQVETDIATLKATLATVTLEFVPATVTVLDERTPSIGNPVRNRYEVAGGKLVLGARSGSHKLTVSAPGHKPQTIELQLTSGQSVTKKVELVPEAAAVAPVPVVAATTTPTPTPADPQPTPSTSEPAGAATPPTTDSEAEPERPVPVSVWVGLGLTGALGVGAGVVGGLALSAKSSWDDAGRPEADVASGETLNLTTDILIGGAAAAAVVTAVLYFTRPEAEADSDGIRRNGATAVLVPVTDGTSFAGLGIQGSF